MIHEICKCRHFFRQLFCVCAVCVNPEFAACHDTQRMFSVIDRKSKRHIGNISLMFQWKIFDANTGIVDSVQGDILYLKRIEQIETGKLFMNRVNPDRGTVKLVKMGAIKSIFQSFFLCMVIKYKRPQCAVKNKKQ